MNSSEMRVLSAYAVKRLLQRIENRLSIQSHNLAEKIVSLYTTDENKANVGKIHESLFPYSSTASANQALNRFIDKFNEASAQVGEKAICCITQNKKGGPANRWVWFEGIQSELREPITSDLNSVRVLQPQSVLDIGGNLPTIVLVNYNNFNEREAVLEEFGYNAQEKGHEINLNDIGWELGTFGNFNVLLTHASGQGYLVGYELAIKIYNELKPYAIIPVGIGYGAADGVDIGDVMVPGYIVNANRERINAKGNRGANGVSEYLVSKSLKDRLFRINDKMLAIREPEWPKIHDWEGLISKDAHISNKK